MPITSQPKGTKRIGLRFDRRDLLLLRTLARRAEHRELGQEQVQTFSSAADAASTGEPLIVICNSRLEVELMADGYVRLGCRRPVLEALSGGG